jgi:uncharacterized protein YabN with tetrapyrrole methylase and pyrophosphatase domain
VLAALDAEDLDGLVEELGDLLLQVVLHAQIAVEMGEFHMADVIGMVDAKLRRRHPHVFGDVVVNGVDDVLTNWAAIKRAEHEAKGTSSAAEESALGNVPLDMPALARAQLIS